MMAVVDVYDALTADRCYRKALSVDEARGIIIAGRGSHFDPIIVDAFDAVHDKMDEVSRNMSDANLKDEL
jgi:HD-GYP domain-containing protein (c-di-GMP phosphodiesterase class II)